MIRVLNDGRETIFTCPFCGGAATVEDYGDAYTVSCDSKQEAHCMGFEPSTTFTLRKEAIAAWNRRAAPKIVGSK